MRQFIIGGNWKMQIPNVKDAVKRAEEIAKRLINITKISVFIAPSINSLYSIAQILKNTNLHLAGQNIHYYEQGAFTGQNSVLSLIEAGCHYCILGHSEPRRIFGESDYLINLKVIKTLEKGIKPVLCVGETAKERENGLTQKILETQLNGSLKDITEKQINNVIIAYEPVWAIDNKFLNPDIEIRPASIKEASEAHQIIRDWIKEKFGAKSDIIPIIYGGSMKASNAQDLLKLEDIDGGLVGGASLTAKTFLPIIEIADKLTNN
jgi:triosephosphate isomerase